MFADIIVDISVEALDRTFQYHIPDPMLEHLTIGTPVKIPFGNGNRVISGFVVGISSQAKWPESKIKDILEIQQKEICVESQLLYLASWIRNQYGATMNEALKTVLPIKKQIKSVEEHWLNFAISEPEIQEKIEEFTRRHYKAKVRLLQGMVAEGGTMTTKLAKDKYQVTKAVCDAMVEQKILCITDKRVYRNPMKADETDPGNEPPLNTEQQKIVDHFSMEYSQGIRKTYLLYGVTGSGKTRVYMDMIQQVIDQGQQVIVLIPEIALTFQIVSRFQSRFGQQVSVLHSRMSEGERYDQYERAKNGQIQIMVGPRSALFTPFEHVGLIIMDEEHEASYKSENPPKYHAREVALQRAKMAGASVVLGSATPSVESYKKAKEGSYHLYELHQRAGGAKKPAVHVVDLRKELEEGNRSVFSRLLQEKIQERLDRKEQTILFLNRRGYAGFVSCRSCGYVLKCSHCDVSMTAHKNHLGDVDTLVCHYCGHAVAMPHKCPSCGSPYIAAFGMGTQKVEELLHRRFPTARILRMDGDTTSGKHGHESVLAPFRDGQADILIGTQMIVKGHDFPNVTLVAALAADMGLYAGDYRCTERAFDLLMQASGRAGRASKPGEMVIQTYNPEQYAVESVQHQDPEIFYANELAYRRITKYPPYVEIMAVLVMAEQRRQACDCIAALAEQLHRNQIDCIGPAEAGLSRAKDRYRYILYVKAEDDGQMMKVKRELEQFSQEEKWDRICSIQYDVNPMNGY
ncbi:MAG: primosomal protein N' [Eubacterium sp.]|nr:primosomal protein N' [Eubacterium sp.]